jgi:endo-1,4-beta-xylanase
VLRGHAYATTRRYRGRIDRWDVVNEVLDWTGRRRPSVWQNVIGDGYVEDAFRAAHAGDPGARLVYNETGIEFPSPQQDAAVRLVADLRSRGVPIDGVGLQGHLDVDGPPSSEDLDAVISRFAALGVGVEFTEVDVSLPGRPTTDVLARQAAAYATIADACWRHVACDRMTVWGIGDDHGWRGRDARALVLDSGYRGKPALTAVREGLAGEGRLVEQSPAARVAPAH